jgi:hypothetical protein
MSALRGIVKAWWGLEPIRLRFGKGDRRMGALPSHPEDRVMRIAGLFVIVMVIVAWAQNGVAQEVKDTLPTPPEGKTWKLVWHDEFDGTSH